MKTTHAKHLGAVGLVLSLALSTLGLLAAPAQAAPRATISISKTSAVPGEWLVVRGKLPKKKVQRVTLIRTLYGTKVGVKKTKRDGSFRFRFRMASMPREGYRVRGGGARSKVVYVTAQRQEVALTGSPQGFTARITPASARALSLQKRVSPTAWSTVEERVSDGSGVARFSPAVEGPTYRVVARARGAVGEVYSLPLVTAPPPLRESPSELTSPSKVFKKQITSATSAAAKYRWWPAARVWDWEFAEGMEEWSNYATGTGRSSLTHGGMRQYSGGQGRSSVNFGDLSTTFQGAGRATGNWEFKARSVQHGRGYTPYLVRYSLVPAGTPDGVQPRQQIILAEYSGYGTTHRIGVRDGSHAHMRTLSGWPHNRSNWFGYGLQVTKKQVIWVVNRRKVATWKRTPGFSGSWVPRMELVGTPGERMTSTNLATDWIRSFPLKKQGRVTGPQGGFVSTPLAVSTLGKRGGASGASGGVRLGASAAAEAVGRGLTLGASAGLGARP